MTTVIPRVKLTKSQTYNTDYSNYNEILWDIQQQDVCENE